MIPSHPSRRSRGGRGGSPGRCWFSTAIPRTRTDASARRHEINADNRSKLIGVSEAAERLDVPASTLYKQWRSWGLAAYRVGRALKFREAEIDAWLERQRVA